MPFSKNKLLTHDFCLSVLESEKSLVQNLYQVLALLTVHISNLQSDLASNFPMLNHTLQQTPAISFYASGPNGLDDLMAARGPLGRALSRQRYIFTAMGKESEFDAEFKSTFDRSDQRVSNDSQKEIYTQIKPLLWRISLLENLPGPTQIKRRFFDIQQHDNKADYKFTTGFFNHDGDPAFYFHHQTKTLDYQFIFFGNGALAVYVYDNVECVCVRSDHLLYEIDPEWFVLAFKGAFAFSLMTYSTSHSLATGYTEFVTTICNFLLEHKEEQTKWWNRHRPTRIIDPSGGAQMREISVEKMSDSGTLVTGFQKFVFTVTNPDSYFQSYFYLDINNKVLVGEVEPVVCLFMLRAMRDIVTEKCENWQHPLVS